MDSKDIQPKFYSPSDAAKVLGISKFLIYRELQSGNIPHAKVGKRILIPRSWIISLEQK